MNKSIKLFVIHVSQAGFPSFFSQVNEALKREFAIRIRYI